MPRCNKLPTAEIQASVSTLCLDAFNRYKQRNEHVDTPSFRIEVEKSEGGAAEGSVVVGLNFLDDRVFFMPRAISDFIDTPPI
ncbi:hypothetical protein TWF569_004715 [Orbilia oligospora]|nr:hypothetical protein TWF569_004715 [Orbilia oligospora]